MSLEKTTLTGEVNPDSCVKIYKTRKVKTPGRGSPLSAGIDFYVPEDFEPKSVEPQCDVLIPSGIKVKLPAGFALVANNKSGIATKKRLIFGAAVVDEDYQGELHLHLINVGHEAILISPGDKIIQFLLEEQHYVDVLEVPSEEVLFGGEVTVRGTGGFGSTGTK